MVLKEIVKNFGFFYSLSLSLSPQLASPLFLSHSHLASPISPPSHQSNHSRQQWLIFVCGFLFKRDGDGL